MTQFDSTAAPGPFDAIPQTTPAPVGDAPSGVPPEGPPPPAQVIFNDPTEGDMQPATGATFPSARDDAVLISGTQPNFTTDSAGSKTTELTTKYPSLIPAAIGPTEHNANTVVRVHDQKTGWFAEIAVDDDQHHTWLTAQIEAHLAGKS
jgi:hypothetical protein